MSSFKKFKKELPRKEKFCNSLTDREIRDDQVLSQFVF